MARVRTAATVLLFIPPDKTGERFPERRWCSDHRESRRRGPACYAGGA
jgi:hypothetical protein